MAIDAGTVMAYMDMDLSPFSNKLSTAMSQLSTFADNSENAGTRIEALGSSLTSVGTSLTTGLTLPIVGIGTASVSAAASFEEAMSEVQALTGATGSEFDALSEQAQELGASTRYSATEASNAMSELASAGFTTSEIMSAMPGLLDLAASGNVDLATAAGIASSTLRGFGLEASETAHVSDVLAEAAARTNAGITDTGEAMKYIAPVASAMGISIEEVTAAIGLLSNAGIQGGQAGTVLRSALSRLASPSAEAAELMGQLGFNAYDAQGKMLPLKDIIGNLETATAGLTDEQKQNAIVTIFGQEAMSGMLALTAAGPAQLEELTNSLENCDGSASKMAKTMQNNLKGKVTELKSALEGAGIAIGEKLIPALTNGVKKITEVVSAFNNLDEGTQKSIVKFGLVAAAIGPVVTIAGKLVTGFGKLITIINGLSTAIGGVGIAGMTTGLLAAGAAVGVFAAGVYVTHEALDVFNRKATKSREEMSFVEKAIADMTGEVTYSKQELIDMGLVYDDFNENISEEFRSAIQSMDEDVDDFGLTLSQISLDNVLTEQENNEFISRVDATLEECINAINEKQNTIQSGLQEAFSVDGVLDDNDAAILNWWNERGQTEKEEAQKLHDEITQIEQTAFSEGRALTGEEEEAIRQRYARIKQIELECQANNSYEMEYAQTEFQNRMQNIDAEGASKLLQQRIEGYKENEIQIKTQYDTLISQVNAGYEGMSAEDKAYADETTQRLRETQAQLLEQNASYYQDAIQYCQENNENLLGIIDFTNGKILEGADLTANERLVKAQTEYEGLNNITETGTYQLYNTISDSMEDVTVVVDEASGLITGIVQTTTDENGMQVQRWCGYNDQLQEDTAKMSREMQQSYNEARYKIQESSSLIVGANGQIIGSNGQVVGSLQTIVDANGQVVTSILGVNGQPINITGNWQEAIDNITQVNSFLNDLNGKTVQTYISVQTQGNQMAGGPIQTDGYATGTDNATSGLTQVAEYGSELIASSYGLALATGRQLINLQGGEKVYNARQTRKILSEMEKGRNPVLDLSPLISRIDDLIKIEKSKIDTKVVNHNYGGVTIEAQEDIRDLLENINQYNRLRR